MRRISRESRTKMPERMSPNVAVGIACTGPLAAVFVLTAVNYVSGKACASIRHCEEEAPASGAVWPSVVMCWTGII